MPSPSSRSQRHPVDRHVGERVYRRRRQRGLSQADLARLLGLSFQQVQKYETGANRISASRLWAIAAILEVNVGAFFADLPVSADPERRDWGQRLVEETSTGATTREREAAALFAGLAPSRQKLVLLLLVEMSVCDRPPAP